jgi:flagellar biosynthesis protein FlhB
MEGGEQDKSEHPTPFKLERARRQGNVARGPDLGFFSALTGGLAAFWLLGPDLGVRLADQIRRSFVIASQLTDSREALLRVFADLLVVMAAPTALIAATVFLAVLALELVQVGFVFSTETLRLDFKRLDPAANLKRLVSPKLLIETVKSVGKLLVYAGVAALLITAALGEAGAMTDATSLSSIGWRLSLRLLGFFALAAAAFALFDQIVVRRDFLKRMRMSRREVRREHKDREGDPRLKRRRKELHAQFVKVSQSLRGVREADVLVTNPTHFAVALRYDPQRDEAPLIVAQGAHQIAQRLRRLATLYGVTIHQDPPLARALYRGELGREIVPALYPPVAELYRRLRSSDAERA